MIAVVTGMIATFPVGGVAWDYGQYMLGLERLGWDVYYLEDTAAPAYDPITRSYGDNGAYGAHFLGRFLSQHSPRLGNRWHVRAADGQTYGMTVEAMTWIVAEADLFLNVSGGCVLREEYLVLRQGRIDGRSDAIFSGVCFLRAADETADTGPSILP